MTINQSETTPFFKLSSVSLCTLGWCGCHGNTSICVVSDGNKLVMSPIATMLQGPLPSNTLQVYYDVLHRGGCGEVCGVGVVRCVGWVW